MADMHLYREFVKDSIRKTIDFRQSDQHRGRPTPPMEEPVDAQAPRLALPGREAWQAVVNEIKLSEAIRTRRSRRNFTDKSLKIEELAFLLWATQGVRDPGRKSPHFRTVPSAGARHSFETYLFIDKVETITPGLYRYLPLSHELV